MPMNALLPDGKWRLSKGYQEVELHMKMQNKLEAEQRHQVQASTGGVIRGGGQAEAPAFKLDADVVTPGHEHPRTQATRIDASLGSTSKVRQTVRIAAVVNAPIQPTESHNRAVDTPDQHQSLKPASNHNSNEAAAAAAAEPVAKLERGDAHKNFLLVVVKTGPRYFERRNITRRLWLNRCRGKQLAPQRQQRMRREDPSMQAQNHRSSLEERIGIECLFLTGQSTEENINAELRREGMLHKDLIVAPLQDGYDVMSAKTQWTLVWSLLGSRRNFEYVLLVDDDTYVVFSNLIPWLLEQPRQEFYAGHLHYDRQVKHCHRFPHHRNCVDQEAFGEAAYPPFASGFAYILSRDAAISSVLRTVAKSSRPLPGNVEDAMLGVLLRESGIHLTAEEGFVHWVDESRRCTHRAAILVVGNAPGQILERMAMNEQQGIALCTGL